MKTKLKLTLLLFGILFATSSFAESKRSYRHEETEEIRERFTVSANSLLDIDTRYGNVVIIEGKQNEIVIHVIIELKSNKPSNIDDMREGISIDIYKSGNRVVAITEIDMNLGGRNKGSFNINYYVKVPKDYIPTIKNKYGNIKLESVATGADIEVKYGSFSAMELKGTTRLESKYSNVRVENAEKIEMEMGYGNSNITKVREMEIGEYKYGNLSIENVDRINIEEFKYGNLTIDKVNRSFECGEIKYSKLSIKECSNELEKIRVDGGYTPIRVSLPATLQFRSELSTRYGNISNQHSDRMSISELEAGGQSVTERSTTKGKSSNFAEIDISTTYSNITIR